MNQGSVVTLSPVQCSSVLLWLPCTDSEENQMQGMYMVASTVFLL